MKSRVKMKRVCLAFFFVAAVPSLFLSRGFAGEGTAKTTVPKLEISEESYDAGKIKQGTQSIQHVFKIKNKGSGDLKITSVSAS